MPMSRLHDPYGTSAHLEALHDELIQLRSRYGRYLKDEAIQGDVECLTSWIESYQQGSREAAEYLQEYGGALMENISSRLKAATADQQRIEEESPTAGKHSTGSKTHHLSRASALAAHAEEDLEAALEDETR